MAREIKFRAWDTKYKHMNMFESHKSGIEYYCGEFSVSSGYDSEDHPVYGETEAGRFEIMQYTGLKDSSEKEIYEGDIVEYCALKNFTQQSFDELPPEIDEYIIVKIIDQVIFVNGGFVLKGSYDPDCELYFGLNCGLSNIESIKDCVFGDNRKNIYSEDEMLCDMDGTEINESIIGVKVIGNIHQNPELLENK